MSMIFLRSIFCVLFILNLVSPAFAMDMDEQDKQYHMGASYALQTSTSLFLRHNLKMKPWESALYGALGTLAIGAAKEYAFDPSADPQDMEANLLGVAVGVPIVFIEF